MLTDGVFDRMDGNGWRWCTECTKLMPWADHLDCQSDSCACRDPDADAEELAAYAVGRAQSHALRCKSPRLRYVPGVSWNHHWQRFVDP